jgi:hypothetical protein
VTRVRSFRNVLYVAAAMLTAVAVLIAIIGWRDPNALPICFAPDTKIVCPPAASTGGGSSSSTPPIGLACIAITRAFVEESRDPNSRGIDWPGQMTLGTAGGEVPEPARSQRGQLATEAA